eukprot:2180134-Heterocapsa_arctica.AAC.1
MKKVTPATASRVILVVDFAVMEVSHAILSVGELHKQGHDVVFGQNSRLLAGSEDVPLITVGNMSYLEAEILSANVMDKLQ